MGYGYAWAVGNCPGGPFQLPASGGYFKHWGRLFEGCMNATHFPDGRTCPHCNTMNDGAMATFGETTPALGDISICVYCTALSAFADGGLRKLTPEEEREVAGDAQVLNARKAVALFNRSRLQKRRARKSRVHCALYLLVPGPSGERVYDVQ